MRHKETGSKADAAVATGLWGSTSLWAASSSSICGDAIVESLVDAREDAPTPVFGDETGVACHATSLQTELKVLAYRCARPMAAQGWRFDRWGERGAQLMAILGWSTLEASCYIRSARCKRLALVKLRQVGQRLFPLIAAKATFVLNAALCVRPVIRGTIAAVRQALQSHFRMLWLPIVS